MKRTGIFLLLFIILSGKTYGHGDEFYTTYSAFGMYNAKQENINSCTFVFHPFSATFL